MAFLEDNLKPGERLPDVDLPTAGGERFRSADFRGLKPLLIMTGSLTCPMTATAMPILKRLHATYGDAVEFVLLQVREAHPGEGIGQPHDLADKLQRARELKARDDVPFTIAVDDVEGAVHRLFGSKPNSAHLIDRDGTVAFRAALLAVAAVIGTAAALAARRRA